MSSALDGRKAPARKRVSNREAGSCLIGRGQPVRRPRRPLARIPTPRFLSPRDEGPRDLKSLKGDYGLRRPGEASRWGFRPRTLVTRRRTLRSKPRCGATPVEGGLWRLASYRLQRSSRFLHGATAGASTRPLGTGYRRVYPGRLVRSLRTWRLRVSGYHGRGAAIRLN